MTPAGYAKVTLDPDVVLTWAPAPPLSKTVASIDVVVSHVDDANAEVTLQLAIFDGITPLFADIVIPAGDTFV